MDDGFPQSVRRERVVRYDEARERAVAYVTTLEELALAAATAFAHTRPGGAALWVPDCTRETFVAGTDHGGEDDPDGRSLRYLEWTVEADPKGTTYDVHYAYLLNDGTRVWAEYDHHVCGLFSRAQWIATMENAGFMVETPELDPEVHEEQVAFLCRRPLS